MIRWLMRGRLLRLREGDVVVFEFREKISHDVMARLRRVADESLPEGVKLLVADGDTKIKVIRDCR